MMTAVKCKSDGKKKEKEGEKWISSEKLGEGKGREGKSGDLLRSGNTVAPG